MNERRIAQSGRRQDYRPGDISAGTHHDMRPELAYHPHGLMSAYGRRSQSQGNLPRKLPGNVMGANRLQTKTGPRYHIRLKTRLGTDKDDLSALLSQYLGHGNSRIYVSAGAPGGNKNAHKLPPYPLSSADRRLFARR